MNDASHEPDPFRAVPRASRRNDPQISENVAERVRQGRIVLRTPAQKVIFFLGLAAPFVVVVALWLVEII